MDGKTEPFSFLKNYLPNDSYPIIARYLKNKVILVKVTPPRMTKAGDFTFIKNQPNSCRITVNNSGNKYEFLITLVHEIAHFYVFLKHKNNYLKLKPHGYQWKTEFSSLMQPLMSQKIFPKSVLERLKRHMMDPKASTSTDVLLVKALNQYAPKTNHISVREIPIGKTFLFRNGIQYTRGRKKIKRIECIEITTGKKYLFHQEAMVRML
ncbi:MAG: sprT domain-containing protein [Flavobacteriaceae bacterium]|nr:sprT domain-containing protein [Flavobacteriaceae bacterium]